MIVVPPQATDSVGVITGRIGRAVGGGVAEGCVERCLGVDGGDDRICMSGFEGGDHARELSVEDRYGRGFVRRGSSWESNFLRGLLNGFVVKPWSARARMIVRELTRDVQQDEISCAITIQPLELRVVRHHDLRD